MIASRRARLGRITTITLLALSIGAARAHAQTILPSDDTFSLAGRVGVQFFHYQEQIGSTKGDFDSVGPALGVTASWKVIDRWRLNGDYLGSFVQKNSETFKNIGTSGGAAVDQEDRAKVDFHLIDLDVSYSFIKTPTLEWAAALGWHYYAENFTRSNFRFSVASLAIPTRISPVSEDVNGQGIKVGTLLGYRATDAITVGGGLAWYGLYQVHVDNSANGTIDTSGNAVRWKLSAAYALTKAMSVGAQYEGHFIDVSHDQNSRAVLPHNQTLANTISGAFEIRF
jgi:hypothetical protein